MRHYRNDSSDSPDTIATSLSQHQQSTNSLNVSSGDCLDVDDSGGVQLIFDYDLPHINANHYNRVALATDSPSSISNNGVQLWTDTDSHQQLQVYFNLYGQLKCSKGRRSKISHK